LFGDFSFSNFPDRALISGLFPILLRWELLFSFALGACRKFSIDPLVSPNPVAFRRNHLPGMHLLT